MIFVIESDNSVTAYRKVKSLPKPLPQDHVRINKPDDFWPLSLAVLLQIYNRGAVKGMGKPIEKFRDRNDAHRRTFTVLEILAKKIV